MTIKQINLVPQNWKEYELLDWGDGAKLERYGSFVLVRPHQGVKWQRALPAKEWEKADAIFELGERGKGQWVAKRNMPEEWLVRYDKLAFYARLTPFRHTGIFPEQAPHWDWMMDKIRAANRSINVLNLFAYTGIATLAAASAGASVTHVDASKPTLAWAKENAQAAGLSDRPIRWLQDDAIKFVQREARRGKKYEGIIIDPPVFGHGPEGQVWRFPQSFLTLIEECKKILADKPLFVVVTAYETKESPMMLSDVLSDRLGQFGGTLTAGELMLRPSAGHHLLSTSIYARWSK